ncbi:hypothetical protein FRC15_010501 [Serendipita sp. 397]|nr:hypothetical protein FRC15_010501 [Serendipita sp. 397]
MNGDGSQTLAGHSPVAGRGPGGAGDKLSFDFDFLRLARDLFLKPIWFRTSRYSVAEGRIGFASKLKVVPIPSDDDRSEHAI